MGMLVLAGFYCDGRPQIQSRADPGWDDWMVETGTAWVRAVRNHPSIVIWRPIDIGPNTMMAHFAEFANNLTSRVRREDGTRPLVFAGEGNEIDSWAQSPLKDPRAKSDYDDGSRLVERFTGTTRPFLTKEIYTGFADVENLHRFFRTFTEKSLGLGSTGVIVQHLPLIARSRPFRIDWLSPSGRGNRDTGPAVAGNTVPNWCDPAEPAWTPTAYSTLFRDLYATALKQAPAAEQGARAAEFLVSGLAPDDLALLVPQDPTVTEATGTRAAADGTAWLVAPEAGAYELIYPGGSRPIRAQVRKPPRKPGYDDIERIAVPQP
jgi:hypothetical protein